MPLALRDGLRLDVRLVSLCFSTSRLGYTSGKILTPYSEGLVFKSQPGMSFVTFLIPSRYYGHSTSRRGVYVGGTGGQPHMLTDSLCLISFPNSTVVPKVCSVDSKGSATSSQEIRGYISVMAALKLLIFC